MSDKSDEMVIEEFEDKIILEHQPDTETWYAKFEHMPNYVVSASSENLIDADFAAAFAVMELLGIDSEKVKDALGVTFDRYQKY